MRPRAADVMTAEFTGADQGQIMAPGATIGILGGGQLGRMTALAAARLGYRCHIYCPDERLPGSAGGQRRHRGAPMTTRRRCSASPTRSMSSPSSSRTSPTARREFLATLQADAAEAAACCTSARTGCARRISSAPIGVPATRYLAGAVTRRRWPQAVRRLGLPARAEDRASFGYDGKGQVRIDRRPTWPRPGRSMGGDAGHPRSASSISRCEISVIVARGLDGQMALFPPVENRHKQPHPRRRPSCRRASTPRDRRPGRGASRATSPAALELVGLLAVEMFVTKSGEVLVNELAPRPHNSGHWTIDACITSQFEQFVRAVCGLPLGSHGASCADAVDEEPDRRRRASAGARSWPSPAPSCISTARPKPAPAARWAM